MCFFYSKKFKYWIGYYIHMETQMNVLEAFAEKIRDNVKVAENIRYNKNTDEITMWINNYFVVLDPQFDDDELIYTTIKIEEWYYGKVVERFYLSTGKVLYEHYTNSGYEKFVYECDFGPNTEDPIILVDEQSLFDFLNSLEEFDFKEEFKSFAGLQP